IGAALEGRARRLGLGRVDGRYFVLNCGAGIDAEAMGMVDQRHAESRAEFERAALSAVLKTVLLRYAGRKPFMSVSTDGGEPTPAVTALVGRTDPYTFSKRFGVRLTTMARLDGGPYVTGVSPVRWRSASVLLRRVWL